MRQDVDRVAERVAEIEPPHPPGFVGDIVDNLGAGGLRTPVDVIHVVDLDREPPSLAILTCGMAEIPSAAKVTSQP
jgi:hypothetical protein